MSSRRSLDRVVLATGNPGKLRELGEFLRPLGIKISAQSDFLVPEIEETGLTFIENALLKARNAARHTTLSVIADDSGIEVDALNGAPGIFSARYAGPDARAKDNNHKLLQALADLPESARSARFHCVIVLLQYPEEAAPLIAQGVWEGCILNAPLGDGGFGYDPVFLPAGLTHSAAELDPAQKIRISHRGQALRRLRDFLQP